MCWVGKLGETYAKQIAQEDTRVVKILTKQIADGKYFAYWRNTFEYKLGKLYETELGIEDRGYIEINEGFHCYSNLLEFVEKKYGYLVRRDSEVIATYSHSHNGYLKVYDTIKARCRVILVTCTIPKGSEYWINDYGEIVTNKLIINREVKES